MQFEPQLPARKPDYRGPTAVWLNPNGTVTLFNILNQRWETGFRPSDAVFATLPSAQREAIIEHLDTTAHLWSE